MSAGSVPTPDPPVLFEPLDICLPAGARLYRAHENKFRTPEFRPSPKGPGRFHYFGTPHVPVLYAAATEEAAIAEVLLRNIPATGGHIPYGDYERKVMAGLEIQKDVRLASFLGNDLRAMGVTPEELINTPGENYPQTRKWAAAAHEAGFDGIAWMSRQDSKARSYVFFGDRVEEPDFKVVAGSGRIFAMGADQDWLIDLCVPLHVDVLPRGVGR